MFSYKYLLLATSLLSAVNGQVLNLITNTSVEGYWLESGYVHLDDSNWVSVSTTELNATEPIVFLGLPPVEGETYADGYPSAPRLRNIAVGADGSVTFEAKIYLVPNDTTKCSHQWSVPQPITVPLEISWTVVEKGAYSLGGHYFFAFDGEIWRHNASLKAGLSNSPIDEYILIRFMGGDTNCTALPGNHCKFPDSLKTPISPTKNYYSVAAISTLQTLRNDQFLMVRGAVATLQAVRLVLTPNDFLDLQDYNITHAERAGVFVFEKGITVLCKEHLSFETNKFDDVTSNPVHFKYALHYSYTPGVYGMIMTHTSITDSTGLRVFNRNSTHAMVILQEDQCVDEQVIHENEESVGMLIVGETGDVGDVYCFIIYRHPTSAPTPNPGICSTFLLYDTFGDGWGDNIFFDVTSVDYDVEGNEVVNHQNFTVNCTCNEIEVCSSTGYFNVSVVTVGEPVRNWWEVMWGYVDRFGNTWIGDIDSEATISENEVIWYKDFVSYNVSDNPCDDCPPKPAPPKKEKKDSKDDKAAAPTAPENSNSTSSDEGEGGHDAGHGAGKGDNGKGDAGKGKGKTPPPPAFVDIELKDTEKYGWYDSNGDWVQVCPDSDILFPAVLVYPRYYISNQERTEIIHSGSLCPQDDKFFCHEILPHEGKFVFRVNGFEVTPGDISWEFCGKSGGLHDELQFEMHKGQCHPGVLLSAEDYCDGIVTLGSYAGFMTLSGISHGSLSEIDTLVIEHIILGALSIPSATVSIVATHVSGSNLNIEFALTVELEKAGYDGVFSDMVEASLEDFTTTLSYSASHGFLLTLLTKELKTSLLSSQDILNSVSEISFTKLELVSVTYSDVTKSSAIDKVYTSEDNIATDSNSHPAFNPVVAGLASFFGVLAAGGLLVFIIMKTRSGDKQGHVLLPTESSHHGREIPMAEAVPVLTKKLSQFPKN